MGFSRTATVAIVTRNRKELLRDAIRSALAQDARPQVIVIDDGSTDGTSDVVRSEFPRVLLVRNERPTGYIVARNLTFALATGDVVFTIDDDAEFTTPRVITQVLGQFGDERVGVVAMRFCHVHDRSAPTRVEHFGPFASPAERCATNSFVGCASAIRRDVFQAVGGYRDVLVHWGEEVDVCMRICERGYIVEVGRNDLVLHYPATTGRVYHNTRLYSNPLALAYWNAPARFLPLALGEALVRGGLDALRKRCPLTYLRGLAQGLALCWTTRTLRAPVRSSVYALLQRCRRSPRRMIPLEEAADVICAGRARPPWALASVDDAGGRDVGPMVEPKALGRDIATPAKVGAVPTPAQTRGA